MPLLSYSPLPPKNGAVDTVCREVNFLINREHHLRGIKSNGESFTPEAVFHFQMWVVLPAQ